VIDINHEKIAVSEARKLGISVVGICDSNSSPEGIDYPIPGNDDAIRAIRLYLKAAADAILEARATSVQVIEGDADEYVEVTGEAAEPSASPMPVPTPVLEEVLASQPEAEAAEPVAVAATDEAPVIGSEAEPVEPAAISTADTKTPAAS